jgi:hypothetical protein
MLTLWDRIVAHLLTAEDDDDDDDDEAFRGYIGLLAKWGCDTDYNHPLCCLPYQVSKNGGRW